MKFLAENDGRFDELRKWQPEHPFFHLAPFMRSDTVWSEMKALNVMHALDAIAKDQNVECAVFVLFVLCYIQNTVCMRRVCYTDVHIARTGQFVLLHRESGDQKHCPALHEALQ